MNRTTLTKKELLEMFADIPEDGTILFSAYHFEPSGRRSNIADNLDIRVYDGIAKIELSQDKPECLEYDD
jgi:hypothetical protein